MSATLAEARQEMLATLRPDIPYPAAQGFDEALRRFVCPGPRGPFRLIQTARGSYPSSSRPTEAEPLRDAHQAPLQANRESNGQPISHTIGNPA